jgi:hypothetical protein
MEKYKFTRYFPEQLLRQISNVGESITKSATNSFVSSLKTRLKDRIFFNVCDLICEKFVSDKHLLVDLFMTTGKRELEFIEFSGIFMGVICGVGQIGIMYSLGEYPKYNPYLVFSLVGLVIGYITNWIALFVIFNPVRPVYITKRWFLQGLFLRRQREASLTYSKLITDSVLNTDEIILYLKSKGKLANILDMFNQIVRECVEESLPNFHIIPQSTLTDLGSLITQTAVCSITSEPRIFESLKQYIELQLDLHRTISSKLMALPPEEFENMLHPVFQEDEFLLTLIGGALGAMVGVIQVYFLSS